MKKFILSLSVSTLVVFGFTAISSNSAQASDLEPVSITQQIEDAIEEENIEFDIEYLEAQEHQVELENGETLTIGMEPVVDTDEISIMANYNIGTGRTTGWRTYYDVGSLASEFYADIYVPSKNGNSTIERLYGERPIRIIGGTLQSEKMTLHRKTGTSSAPAHASYRINTNWYNGYGSATPTLHLKVKGSTVTTSANGFWW